jgi:hypothetical protein
MKVTKHILLHASIAMLLVSVALSGSKNRTGTGGATELTIPIGARSIAMGNATVATATGIDALFYNPAGTASNGTGTTLFVSHMNYIADISVDCGAVSVNVPSFGVLSLQLVGYSVGEIMLTTTDLPDGFGATFKPQFFTGGLTYSTNLTDRISIGFTGTLISESMATVSATGFAFSAGAIYDNLGGINGLKFGVVLKNVGPQMKFDGSGLNVNGSVSTLDRPPYFYKIDAASFELPSSFEIGIGYKTALMDDHSVTFSTAFQNNNFSDDAYRIGAEYSFQNVVFVRGGYDYSPSQVDQRENIFGTTFGVGLRTNLASVDVAFDYAFRSVKYFGGNHVFSLTAGL